jgi:hypothetical protein
LPRADIENRVGGVLLVMFLVSVGRSVMMAPRTAKTLVLLVAAMTAGAFALVLMRTEPIAGPVGDAAAAVAREAPYRRVVHETSVPVQTALWRNIVIHSSRCRRGAAGRCHFLVRYDRKTDTASVVATRLWKQQGPGSHTFAAGRDWNADSVGVFLEADCSEGDLPDRQNDALIKLVQTLQRTLRISADHVYLHSDLDPYSPCPGVKLNL